MDEQILWAPWRSKYVQGLDNSKGCFLCSHAKNPLDDDKNFVLWRSKNALVALNLYPYNNGHLLISPLRHIAELSQATDEEMLEMIKLVRESQKVLSLTLNPHGFNAGINLGRCAGAGLPGHFHIHLVPRWNGDTNFINTCCDTDVISQSIAELFKSLKTASRENNLPGL